MADLVPNPGISFEADQTGALVLTAPFWAATIQDARERLPRTLEGLGLSRYTAKERPSSKGFDIVAVYEGLSGGGDGQGPGEDENGDWEVDSEFSEEPIKSHHLIALIKERYQGVEEDGEIKFPEFLPGRTFGDGRGTAGRGRTYQKQGVRNPAYGLETYFQTGAIVRRTRIMFDLPEDFFRRINRVIDRPPIPALAGVDWGDRNFLTLVPRPRRRGNAIEMVEEWKLSAPGGWPPVVYGLIDRR